MLRKTAFFLLSFVILLTGCSAKNPSTQKALDLRVKLMEAGGCSFTADITADYDQRVYDFSVTCDYQAGQEAKITVTEPEEIAGISAKISADTARLEFDGLELEFGQMANGLVSPMEACWVLTQSWNSGYIHSVGADEELMRITCLDGYGDKELTVDTWLDEAGIPVHGEITYEGVRRLALDITEFRWDD